MRIVNYHSSSDLLWTLFNIIFCYDYDQLNTSLSFPTCCISVEFIKFDVCKRKQNKLVADFYQMANYWTYNNRVFFDKSELFAAFFSAENEHSV